MLVRSGSNYAPLPAPVSSAGKGGATGAVPRKAWTILSIAALRLRAGPSQMKETCNDMTTHPIIRSMKRGESWKWCYVDRALID
jgi:hypothetical protein